MLFNNRLIKAAIVNMSMAAGSDLPNPGASIAMIDLLFLKKLN